jgi:hypothetical protein
MMTSNRFRRERFAFLSILVLLLGSAGLDRLAAQGTTATIVGTVTDSSKAAIPGATIQVKNVDTGANLTLQSDGQGRFTAADLAAGGYEIQAAKEGFQTVVRKGVTLSVGSQPVVDFALPVGQSQQTVTVEAQVTQVETTNATVSALVDQKQMAELPLNGRNFESLILLAPGVQYIYAVSASGAQGRSTSYSVSGSRASGQALLLDDENMQTFWNRGLASISGSSLGVEAIGEFQTLTNTYSAQFGGNGVAVNSVSKSGTNAFHGSAYEFLRNSALDARNFFDPGNSPPPFRRNQFGGSIGGPIKKNKMFFFANYEGIRQLLGETKIAFVPTCNPKCVITATNPATAQAIAQTLALYPLATTNVGNGIGQSVQVANQIAHENYILARFDYNLSDKDSIFGRYVSDKADFFEPFGGNGATTAIPLWWAADISHNQFSTVGWRRIVSPTLVNVARASFSRPAANEAPAPPHSAMQYFPGSGRVDGILNITGLTALGPNLWNPFVLNQNKFTGGDDVTWTHGAHTLRMGVAVTRFQTNTALQQYAGINWTFQSLPNFLAGNALRLVGTPLGPQFYGHFDLRETDIMPYVQDDWKVNSKLTVNLGLRWEYQTDPVTPHNTLYMITDYAHGTGFTNVPNVMKSNPSTANWAPRIGLAYDPFADHKTSIRAGFGIFHDLITPSVYWPALTGTQPWQNYTQNNPTYPTPFTGALVPPKPAVAPGWDYFTSVTPYMLQYNLTVQREIVQGTVLSVGYIGARGVHLFNGTDQNPVQPTVDSSGVYHFATVVNGGIVANPRLNSNFAFLDNNIPAAYSRYNSMQASLNRRFSRNVQVQAAYTYSNCMDNGGSGLGALSNNTSSIVENPFNRRLDYGPCAQDIRHALRVNAVATLPFHGNRLVEGWQFSGIVSASTGVPFNFSDGFDDLAVGAGTNPGGVPRPNYIAGCQLHLGLVNQWYNPACFSVPAPGVVGNVGRDLGRGPNLQDTDLSLSKETRIKETLRVQFRAEVFNLFNHANFALPVGSVFTAGAAGACTATGAGCGLPNSTAGRITATATTARQLQFGLKLVF